MGGWEWAFWIAAAVALLAALATTYCAFLHDRARGRRRCPRCWYDMSGSPGLTCSECGRTARHERKLQKTRRHWRMAMLAVGIAAVGAGLGVTPAVYEHGWWRIAPTTVLIAFMPDLPTWSKEAGEELDRRIGEDLPWDWQWRLLIGRINPSSTLWSVDVKAPANWPRDVPLVIEAKWTPMPKLRELASGSRLRARLEPMYHGSVGPVQVMPRSAFGPSGTPDEAILHVGAPRRAAGATELAFRLTIEMATPPPGRALPAGASGGRWRVLHSELLTRSVTFEGAASAHIEIVDSAEHALMLQQAMSFELGNMYLFARFERDRITTDVVWPLQIELLRNGDAVHTWRTGSIDRAGTQRASGVYNRLLAIPLTMRGEMRPFGTMGYRDFTWSLRVRGDVSRAIFDGAAACWGGEFHVPLYLHETEDSLMYRSSIEDEPREPPEEPSSPRRRTPRTPYRPDSPSPGA
jgi:hypothetical protein